VRTEAVDGTRWRPKRKFFKSRVNPGCAVFGAGSGGYMNASCGRTATSGCASVPSCVRVAASVCQELEPS
jgi:hypothetical protein